MSMDYQDLAAKLMQRVSGSGQGGPLGTFTAQDLVELRKFLKTAAGREAVRGSIDNVVIRTKNPQMSANLIPHQDIMRSLVYSMQENRKYNADPAAVDTTGVA
jgi:hypothetical protein